jgi:hypothetical protein
VRSPCHEPKNTLCHCSLHTCPLHHHLPLHLTPTNPPSFDTKSSPLRIGARQRKPKKGPDGETVKIPIKQTRPQSGRPPLNFNDSSLSNSPSYLKVASSSRFNKTNVDITFTFSYTNIENTSVLSPSPNTSQTGAVQDPPQHAMKQNVKSATKGKDSVDDQDIVHTGQQLPGSFFH